MEEKFFHTFWVVLERLAKLNKNLSAIAEICDKYLLDMTFIAIGFCGDGKGILTIMTAPAEFSGLH
ncbi:MAG: hypothetical protein HOH38_08605 [Nitrospinaceae bacterium]|nr:hypothetical protein [Nitrospinaceae bacterium]